jgi:O-antigen/teichoic acid export membrane protein
VVHRTAAGRERRIVTGILTSFGAAGAGAVAALVIAPVMFRRLGPDRFGVWAAVTALTSVALFADLGMGNSLLTRLPALRPVDVPGLLAAAYRTVAGSAAVLLSGVVAVVLTVPAGPLFGVTDPVVADQTAAVLVVCFAAFAVNLPLALIGKVQTAMQDIARVSAWSAATAAWTVVSVTAAAAAGLPPLALIAVAVTAAPLGNLANTLHYYRRVRPGLRPRFGAPADRTGRLLRLGLRYFTLSVLTSSAANLDGYLVARWLGPATAAHYALTVRLFIVLNLLVTVVNTPLWPANAAALARGDRAWVRRTTRRMCVLSGGLVGAAALALVVASPLLERWVDAADFHGLPTGVVALLAVWPVLLAVLSPMFMVQNSVGLLGPQLAGWGAFLLLSLPVKAVLAARFGLAGIPVAGTVVFAVTVVPACIVGYRAAIEQKNSLIS